jgi:Flp pilus assembly protein TadD
MALTLIKLGRRQDAVNAFQQSLRIRPTAGAARNLASLLLMSGDPSDAVKVYQMAMQIDPGDLQNQRALAWVLATHPDDHVRNGKEAVELAQQIVQATNGQVPQYLLAWCAALAESGDFDQAVAVASRAAESYRRSGDARTATFLEQTIIPALQHHQALRDDPRKSLGN